MDSVGFDWIRLDSVVLDLVGLGWDWCWGWVGLGWLRRMMCAGRGLRPKPFGRVDSVDPGAWAWVDRRCRAEHGGRVDDSVDLSNLGGSMAVARRHGRVDGVDPTMVGGSTASTRGHDGAHIIVDSVDPSTVGGSMVSTRLGAWSGVSTRVSWVFNCSDWCTSSCLLPSL